MSGEKMTFEDELKKLEESVEKVKSEDTTLEDAIEIYKKGVLHYENASIILENARQKIETYKK